MRFGDAVNVAARLCSLAQSGEIVADAKTVAHAPEHGFGDIQRLSVKGRKGMLTIQRTL